MIVTGTTGNTIFLPAAGMWKGTEFNYSGSYGYYWSSTLTENKSERARCLVIYSNEKVRNGNVRYIGYSIRPVSD